MRASIAATEVATAMTTTEITAAAVIGATRVAMVGVVVAVIAEPIGIVSSGTRGSARTSARLFPDRAQQAQAEQEQKEGDADGWNKRKKIGHD